MNAKHKRTLYRILISSALFVAAYILEARLDLPGWQQFLLFMPAYLLIGWSVLKEAAVNISHGQVFDENFLMALATIGALCIGEYPEAVAVMLFYQVGELFQSYAVNRSRQSITQLMDIRPDFANIEQDGQLVQVDPETVAIGDIVIVKPGERVPLDGTVMEGTSSLNTAALTGESLPRNVQEGEQVLSGCVNLTGVLHVRADKLFGESTASRILDLVENASDKKARTENFITRFARYYTPFVVIGALLLAVIPPLVTGGNWSEWINRALIFLVISCPCALVISIPLSFFGGIGGASKKGVLVKGGNYLEALAEAQIVVFDKTGTLTEGSFSVVAVHPEQVDEKQLLEYAALAESFSNHPISLSLKKAYGQPIDNARITDASELSGRGVQALVDGKKVLEGNGKLMDENGIKWHECDQVGTISHVAVDGEYMGHIVIADTVKPNAAQTIRQLKQMGIERTVMLTGDSTEVGQAVAKQLGLDEAYCQLMPQDKVEHVEKLLGERTGKGKLAFVGDGINDAPVLARADIGIAMGALGSDAAIEAADIVLMDDKLSGIATAIQIAKKTLRIAKQNIVFALGIKAIFLIMGAFGIATMWEAVFADVGVSVIAILNAMRSMKHSQKSSVLP
ncbi:cadmium-translocating P-type ATPase [Eubacteriales bacterium OttesenSCG-928-N13]|nr:cadmium-translocating P-type ATPase [Eubacteriales bacterium OttesenSCG-928-N13]